MRTFTIILSTLLLAGATVEDARKANEAYHNGNYAEAIALYKKAITAEPDNAKLYFNLASALAREGKAEEAINTFERFKAMTDDVERRAMADYNIGNILSNAEKWDRAVDYYKEALRYMSYDEDAKHNYELAKQKKKQQEQDRQNQDSQEQQNQQDQQQQNRQNENQDRQQNQQDNKQQNRNQQQNNQQKPHQQQPQKISKAEAEKILKALEQKEKELLKQFKKQKTESSKSTNEKDW